MKKLRLNNILPFVLVLALTFVLCLPMNAFAITNPLPLRATPRLVQNPAGPAGEYILYIDVECDADGNGTFGDVFPDDGFLYLNYHSPGSQVPSAEVTTIPSMTSVAIDAGIWPVGEARGIFDIQFIPGARTVNADGYPTNPEQATGTFSLYGALPTDFLADAATDLTTGDITFTASFSNSASYFPKGTLSLNVKDATTPPLQTVDVSAFDTSATITLPKASYPTETTSYTLTFTPDPSLPSQIYVERSADTYPLLGSQVPFNADISIAPPNRNISFNVTNQTGSPFPNGTLDVYVMGDRTSPVASLPVQSSDGTTYYNVPLPNDKIPTVDTSYEIVYTPTSNIFSSYTADAVTLYASLFTFPTSSTLPEGISLDTANATISPSSMNGFSNFSVGPFATYSDYTQLMMGQALGTELAAKNISPASLGATYTSFDLSLTDAAGLSYYGKDKFTINIPTSGIPDGTKVTFAHYTGIIQLPDGSLAIEAIDVEIIQATVQNNMLSFETTGLSPFQVHIDYTPPTPTPTPEPTPVTTTATSPQTGVYI